MGQRRDSKEFRVKACKFFFKPDKAAPQFMRLRFVRPPPRTLDARARACDASLAACHDTEGNLS